MPEPQKRLPEPGRQMGGSAQRYWKLLNLLMFGGQLAVLIPQVQTQLEEMWQSCLPDGSGYGFESASRFRLKLAKFGADAGAIGGAVLVYQSLFQMPDLLLLHQ